MSIAEPRIAPPVPLGRLTRLWDKEALLIAALMVGVPNVLFLILSPWFLLRRMISPAIYLIVSMIAVFLPWPAGFLVFAVAAAADAFFVVAYLFDMPLETTLMSIRYSDDINIQASTIYIGAGAYFIVLAALLTWLTRRYRRELRRASPLLALLLAVGIGFADFSFNGYKPISKPPFESAMMQNGLTAESIVARDRNLLIVIVEGLGAFADPAERGVLSDRLLAASASGFEIRSGTSNYYGSTTGAEIRELCGTWGTYVSFLRGDIGDCLPAKLARAGYPTTSYHASDGDLFSRRTWYPAAGIGKMNFLEDIERERPHAVVSRCGTVFLGMCDGDVGELVHQDLLNAGNRRGLYYWLTLNSHIPYEPMSDNRFGCRTSAPSIPSLVPCQLAEIWSEVFDKVAEIASDPSTPPVDILIAGDHNTPLWSREAHGHFLPDKVDWYYLEDRRHLRETSGGEPGPSIRSQPVSFR